MYYYRLLLSTNTTVLLCRPSTTTFQKPALRWLFCYPPRPQCWRGLRP